MKQDTLWPHASAQTRKSDRIKRRKISFYEILEVNKIANECNRIRKWRKYLEMNCRILLLYREMNLFTRIVVVVAAAVFVCAKQMATSKVWLQAKAAFHFQHFNDTQWMLEMWQIVYDSTSSAHANTNTLFVVLFHFFQLLLLLLRLLSSSCFSKDTISFNNYLFVLFRAFSCYTQMCEWNVCVCVCVSTSSITAKQHIVECLVRGSGITRWEPRDVVIIFAARLNYSNRKKNVCCHKF